MGWSIARASNSPRPGGHLLTSWPPAPIGVLSAACSAWGLSSCAFIGTTRPGAAPSLPTVTPTTNSARIFFISMRDGTRPGEEKPSSWTTAGVLIAAQPRGLRILIGASPARRWAIAACYFSAKKTRGTACAGWNVQQASCGKSLLSSLTALRRVTAYAGCLAEKPRAMTRPESGRPKALKGPRVYALPLLFKKIQLGPGRPVA